MKSLRIFSFLFGLTTVCSAQLGIELGLGYSSIRGNESVEKYLDDGALSPLLGLTYHLDLATLGVQPSAQITQKGAQGSLDLGNNSGTIDFGFSTWFLDIPLLLAAKPLPGLAILVGPMMSIYLSGSLHEKMLHRVLVEEGLDFSEYVKNGSKELNRDAVNPVSWGIVAGIQYMLPLLNIGVQLRYLRGLTPILKKRTPDLDMKSDFLSLVGFYLF